MASSSLGFGYQPFGNFPFGSSDWAEEILWKLIPEFYRDLDRIQTDDVAQPLRGFIDAIKPSFEDIRIKIQDFPDLWNLDECPPERLDALMVSIGLPRLSDKDDVLKSTNILNSAQLFLFKGTDKGYRTVGAFEGLSTEITPLYAKDCDPGATLQEEGPEYWQPKFDEVMADIIPMDSVYTDRFAIWPWPLTEPVVPPGGVLFDETPLDSVPLDSGDDFQPGPCRSFRLRLHFADSDGLEIEDYTATSRRVVALLEFMRPLHVEFDRISFDGPKSSSHATVSISGAKASVGNATVAISGLKAAEARATATISADIET